MHLGFQLSYPIKRKNPGISASWISVQVSWYLILAIGLHDHRFFLYYHMSRPVQPLHWFLIKCLRGCNELERGVENLDLCDAHGVNYVSCKADVKRKVFNFHSEFHFYEFSWITHCWYYLKCSNKCFSPLCIGGNTIYKFNTISKFERHVDGFGLFCLLVLLWECA